MKLLISANVLLAAFGAVVGAASSPPPPATNATLDGGCPVSANPAACVTCAPTICPVLDEDLTYNGYSMVKTCIDFDRDGVGHCCRTRRNEYSWVNLEGEPTGDCYKYECSGAIPIQPYLQCNFPWAP